MTPPRPPGTRRYIDPDTGAEIVELTVFPLQHSHVDSSFAFLSVDVESADQDDEETPGR